MEDLDLSDAKTRSIAVIAGLLLLGAAVYVCRPVFCGSASARARTSRNGDSRSKSRVYVSEPVRDLGRTSVRKVWEVAFPIQNHGTRRLLINELDLCCGVNRVSRTFLIPPGETADVTVKLDSRSASGPIESTTRFSTNDPAHPTLELTVRAWVGTAEETGDANTDDDT